MAHHHTTTDHLPFPAARSSRSRRGVHCGIRPGLRVGPAGGIASAAGCTDALSRGEVVIIHARGELELAADPLLGATLVPPPPRRTPLPSRAEAHHTSSRHDDDAGSLLNRRHRRIPPSTERLRAANTRLSRSLNTERHARGQAGRTATIRAVHRPPAAPAPQQRDHHRRDHVVASRGITTPAAATPSPGAGPGGNDSRTTGPCSAARPAPRQSPPGAPSPARTRGT